MCFGRGPAKLAENSRNEGTEPLDGTVGAEEAPSTDVGVDVEDRASNMFPSNFAFVDLLVVL